MLAAMGDEAIFLAVVGARFLVPLLIPRFPLPAILAALVIDAADQSIFQQFTDLDLTGYQGYDKALDVYYLTIAYLSTMRNWVSPLAFRTAQFLWYYRLVGVMAFEVTDERWLLLVFANTFEYFFIFYEGVRTSWNPARLGRNGVLGAAAAIWVFIKLPQEWWIHIAQLDFTDVMKEDVFGVAPTASWGEALTNRPVVTIALVSLLAGVALLARWLARRLPPADWPFTVDADTVGRHLGWIGQPPVGSRSEPVWSAASFEKVALIALVTAIFAKMLPGVEATGLQIAVGVAVLVLANAAVAVWRSGRGLTWRSVGARFMALTIIDVGLLGVYTWLLRRGEGTIDLSDAVFFSVLITLIVVLFDRYHRIRSARAVAMASVRS
jgi:hypothetical protein